MAVARRTYGIVEGEKPPLLHRCATISGRSCCGKTLVRSTQAPRSHLGVCRRCIALDESRRSGMPDWF